jgi:hypothetical protein
MFVAALAVLAMSFAGVPALAAGAEGVSLALYGDGSALVREVRTLDLSGPMVLEDVPATLVPESLGLRSLSTPGGALLRRVLFRPGISSGQEVLAKYVGRKVAVLLPDPRDASATVRREGVLLSAGGSPAFLLDDGVWVGEHRGVLLPELPEGLAPGPRLELGVERAGAARQRVELTYLCRGLAWSADYSLVLDAAAGHGALTALAGLENASGTDFSGASVWLVAGEVARVAEPVMLRSKAEMAPMAMSMDAGGMPEPVGVGEQYVYALPGKVDLPSGAAVRAALLSAPDVAVRIELTSTFGVSTGQRAGTMSQAVEERLMLKNDEASGLGMPLPAGTVRVYRAGPDGAPLLAGEARIGHVGVGGEASLRLGSSFDVSVERVQTAWRSTGKRSASSTWEITARNGADVEKRVRLVERFPGEWSLSGATLPWKRLSSGEAAFDLLLPPGGGATTLRYTVGMDW